MAHSPGEAADNSIVQDQPNSGHSVSLSHHGSDLLEATELSRIRTQYSRATASYRRASGSTSQASPTGLWRLRYAIWKFWRNQISVIVAHEACRDHLGTYCKKNISRIMSTCIDLYKDHYLGMRMRASVSHLMS
jgi:hypothetical protein